MLMFHQGPAPGLGKAGTALQLSGGKIQSIIEALGTAMATTKLDSRGPREGSYGYLRSFQLCSPVADHIA